LVEATPDGTFTVTKHPGTGGLVSVHSISEQLLYEMGTPQYLAPDCIARFDSIRLTQDGPDRVKVSGIVGEPPPEKLKVSVSFAVQVVPRVLGSVPGITVLADQGRPRASDVVGYWPALIDRASVPMRVVVGDDEVDVPHLELAAAPAGAAFTPDRPPPRPSGA